MELGLGDIIANRRRELGVSQANLAKLASLSLAGIQKIESNRSNPRLSTIEIIGKLLGLEFTTQHSVIDWNYLSYFGVPLLTGSESKPSKPNLLELPLKLSCAIQSKEISEREKEALVSFVTAIRDHYPSYFKQKLSKMNSVQNLLQFRIEPGRLIKLRRIALERVSQFL